jgi:hypothetical protein
MRPGPEAAMMDAVFQWSNDFVSAQPCWRASSVQVGAGMPDLILATYRPEITKLSSTGEYHAGVLAFLRLVRAATAQTIAEKIGRPKRRIEEALGLLVDAEAIEHKGNVFKLTTRWRQILPKTIAVEAKVSDWRKAVEQASRNSIFVHYSYVALPERLSLRVAADPIFDQVGVGVISVAETGKVRILRRALRSSPIAWYYYYGLALTLSSSQERRRCPFKSPSMTPVSSSQTTLS